MSEMNNLLRVNKRVGEILYSTRIDQIPFIRAGGPRNDLAKKIAGGVFGFFWFGSNYLMGGNFLNTKISLLCLLLFFSVYASGWINSKRSKTWKEELDRQLVSYEPLNKDAYQRLLQDMQAFTTTKKISEAVAERVQAWVEVEREAIGVAIRRLKS